MKSESITIKDIAKALDLSYSTVARALQDNYRISEPIRKKVQDYASQHQYKPNLNAQSLKSKKSRSLGILLPSIPNSFFAEVINGIESIANEKNYHIIITQSHESYEREIKNLEHLSWRSVDGFIVSLSTETTDISPFKKIQENGTPVVFFDRVSNGINTHTITADGIGGSYRLASHLVENGFRKIAQVTSSPSISITCDRLAGYKQALVQHGIAINDQYIKYCEHGGMHMAEIETAVKELLDLPDPPDAIFAGSDRLTLGCFSVLHKLGIRIPDQMALAGFSNFSSPQLFNPSLTVVRQPAFEIGKQAIELILQLIESKRPVQKFENRVLATELLIGDSTKRRNS